MFKHNNHLKHNNTNLIKDTVREMGTKRTIRSMKHTSKMTVSNVKQQQYCNYNSDMNKRRHNSKISLRISMV